jgi:hypothetical protein
MPRTWPWPTLLLLVLPRALAAAETPAAIPWQILEPGLELAQVAAPQKSAVGDSTFTLVRIDPKRQTLKLLMASAEGGGKRTAPQWAKEFSLSAVVNAGMFKGEGEQLQAAYLMKSALHTNNARVARQNAILALDPIDPSSPAAQIIDRTCQDFPALSARYRTLVQGIRMQDCRGGNAWKADQRRWSMVVAATDRVGRVLFCFTRSPYTVHDFIDLLLALPLDLNRMMYLEGGPETSLVIDAGKTHLELHGSFETDFFESDLNLNFWPIPNVIGVVKRPPR